MALVRRWSDQMRHVFISYAREDEVTVNKIREYCEASGISVWMDKESLRLGEPWMQKLRAAIRDGAFFVLCLSKQMAARPSSVVYREIDMALEELRQGPGDQDWFLPLRLDDCPIPKEVAEFTYVDLFPDFDSGAVALVNRLLARLLPDLSPEHFFILGVRHHIMEKIRYFTEIGAPIRKEILGKWLSLIDERHLKQLTIAFSETYGRMKATGRNQLDMMIVPGGCGKVILLSISPHKDRTDFIRSLPSALNVVGTTYTDFIILFRRRIFRALHRWLERDFVHIIYFDDPEDDLLDMLFLESPKTRFEAIARFCAESPGNESISFLDAVIYPTSLLSNLEASSLINTVYAGDTHSGYSRP